MNRKLNLALTFVVGSLGGVASRYVAPLPVLAQAEAPKEIKAQSFVVVDQRNNIVGTFKASMPKPDQPITKSEDPPTVVLLDRNGQEVWRAGLSVKVLINK